MQLKVREYNKISDLFMITFCKGIKKISAKTDYSTDESVLGLIDEVAKILDDVRARHWEQNKKTAQFIAEKRKKIKIMQDDFLDG